MLLVVRERQVLFFLFSSSISLQITSSGAFHQLHRLLETGSFHMSGRRYDVYGPTCVRKRCRSRRHFGPRNWHACIPSNEVSQTDASALSSALTSRRRPLEARSSSTRPKPTIPDLTYNTLLYLRVDWTSGYMYVGYNNKQLSRQTRTLRKHGISQRRPPIPSLAMASPVGPERARSRRTTTTTTVCGRRRCRHGPRS